MNRWKSQEKNNGVKTSTNREKKRELISEKTFLEHWMNLMYMCVSYIFGRANNVGVFFVLLPGMHGT